MVPSATFDSQRVLRLAAETFDIEARALLGLKARQGEDFVKAVAAVLESRGRVVVMGMGKSGHVGRKIAATLASTGTPAFFVHPAEAMNRSTANALLKTLEEPAADTHFLLISNEAERLLPVDLVDPPLRVESMRARTWGAGLLNRALSRLGISPDGVVLLTGMGGPNGVAYIAVYVVPGAPAPGLQHEFRRVIYKGGGRWVERRFGGRVVVMAEGHPPGFDVLFWAVDGHVVHLAGSLPVLEPLVARLPAGVADETQPVGWRPT